MAKIKGEEMWNPGGGERTRPFGTEKKKSSPAKSKAIEKGKTFEKDHKAFGTMPRSGLRTMGKREAEKNYKENRLKKGEY